MNALDIVLLALVGISGLMSLRIGLIREVFALGALLIGIFGAIVLTRTLAPGLPELLGSAVATEVVFFLVVFLALNIMVSLLGSFITRLIRTVHLGWLDRMLGLFFGCVRGALIALLVVIGLTYVLDQRHPLLVESRAVRLSEGAVEVFAELLPPAARDELLERYAEVRAWMQSQEEAVRERIGEETGGVL